MAENIIPVDGERKYRIVAAKEPGMLRIAGLLRRSEWSKVREAELVPMLKVHSATLHCESLAGQLPTIGFEFPEALLRGGLRTGKEMDTHLATLKETRKAERSALKALTAIRAQIL